MMRNESWWMHGAATAALSLTLAACTAEGPGSTETGDVAADGTADGLAGDVASGKADGFTVVEAALGGSYRFEVEAQRGDAVTSAQAKLLRFDVDPGQSFAAIMRVADSSPLDAALILYGEQGGNGAERRAASLYDQALVPMGAETDGAIVYTSPAAGTYLLYASDLELAVTGSFQIDLLALELDAPEPTVVDSWADLDLSVTDAALRTFTARLRDHEPVLEGYVAQGVLEEGADGYLVRHEAELDTLAERAELRRLAAEVDDLRGLLFEQFAATASSTNPLLIERIGFASGAVWGGLRSGEHRLP